MSAPTKTVLRDAFAVVLAVLDKDEERGRFDAAIAPYKLTRDQRELVWLVAYVSSYACGDPLLRERVVGLAVLRAGLGAA